MARTVTLTQLMTDARLYADKRPGGADSFIDDTELTRLVNQALAGLYDRILASRSYEENAQTLSFTTLAGTATYTLAHLDVLEVLQHDVYEILLVTIQWASDQYERVDPIQRRNTPAMQNWQQWGYGSPKGYIIQSPDSGVLGGAWGMQMTFYPTPQSAETIEVQYVPAFSDLVNGSDEFNGINGWEKAVALQVAIEMLIIDQKDPGALMALLDRELQRIDTMVDERDVQNTAQVGEVFPEIRDIYWPPRLPRVP